MILLPVPVRRKTRFRFMKRYLFVIYLTTFSEVGYIVYISMVIMYLLPVFVNHLY